MNDMKDMKEQKEQNFVSVVAYVHDDEAAIPAFAAMALRVLSAHFLHYELIFVDDASRDGSVDAIRAAARGADGTVQIVRMSYPQGLELSMEAGDALAIGDYVYEFDTVAIDYADELVTELYGAALAGHDIVTAAPAGRRPLSSRLFYRLYNASARTAHPLQTETFRLLSRRALNRIRTMSRTIPYRKAVYANCGLPQQALSYEPQGAARRRAADGRFRQAVDALILFTDLGYRAAFTLTAVLLACALLVAAYALAMFACHQAITGWTSLMLVVSLAAAGLSGLGASLAKYLDLLLGLVFRRQTYIGEGIEKL